LNPQSQKAQPPTVTALTPRTNPEAPFCWQSKQARRLIRKHLDGDTLLKIVLSVYDALTEIGSDEGRSTFKTSQPHVGEYAGGYDVRSVQRALPQLKELGLIDYDSPSGKLRGPITYTLLSLDTTGSRNDATGSRNDATGSRNDTTGGENGLQSQSRIKLEKHSEEIVEQHSREGDVLKPFDEFWKAYPKRINRKAAEQAWGLVTDLPPITDLLASLELHKTSDAWTRDDGRWIPAPAKWITDRRFQDDVKPISNRGRKYADAF
jgi:hypothetical protein